jgi:hypothetical protein
MFAVGSGETAFRLTAGIAKDRFCPVAAFIRPANAKQKQSPKVGSMET